MKKSKSFRTNKRTMLVAALIVLALSIGIFLAYQSYQSRSNEPNTKVSDREDIDFSPPTEEDKQAVDQHKDDLANQQEQENKPQPGLRAVTPLITDAGQYGQQVEVRSFVPGIFESGGTCRIVFTKGSSTVTKEVQGLKDATTTRCENLSVARTEFPAAGTWSVTVQYTSATAQGKSEAKTLEVQ